MCGQRWCSSNVTTCKLHGKKELRKYDGEDVIQQGISIIKGVGAKAAETIMEERKKGVFTDYDDFVNDARERQ